MTFSHLLQTASNPPTNGSALESSISALERAISALESEVRALENRSVAWEHSVWIFTFLVVVGVALELWVIRHDWRDEMEGWALGHFGITRLPGRPSLKKLRIEIASVLLITLGVAGELVVGIEIASINGILRGKSAELRSKSAESREKSDQLVAILGREAEELKKDAENERLARVELEDSIAWRRIPLDKRPSIAARLKSYEGQLAWLTYNMNDVEANDFGVDIAGTLKLAKWIPTEPEALMKMLEGPVNLGTNKLPRGVVIRSTLDSSSEAAAQALIHELVNAGFDVTSLPSVPLGTSPGQSEGVDVIRAAGSRADKRPTVFVSIEPRPDGPQGNAKLRREAETEKKHVHRP